MIDMEKHRKFLADTISEIMVNHLAKESAQLDADDKIRLSFSIAMGAAAALTGFHIYMNDQPEHQPISVTLRNIADLIEEVTAPAEGTVQ